MCVCVCVRACVCVCVCVQAIERREENIGVMLNQDCVMEILAWWGKAKPGIHSHRDILAEMYAYIFKPRWVPMTVYSHSYTPPPLFWVWVQTTGFQLN